MNSIRFLSLILSLIVLSACATAPKTVEVREISDWKLVFNQNQPNGDFVRHFIPTTESADSWRHRFNVSFAKPSPAQANQNLRARADTVCDRNNREMSAQLSKMGKPDCQLACNFISASETSVVFEIPNTCNATGSSYQLVRWIATAEGTYYVSFLQKQAIDPVARSKWLTIINAVRPAKAERIRDYFE